MKSVSIKSFMPTRNGKMMIVNPGTENIFLTLEQYNLIQSQNISAICYQPAESYTNAAGVLVKYTEGIRNNFAGISLVSFEEKLAAAAAAGVKFSL